MCSIFVRSVVYLATRVYLKKHDRPSPLAAVSPRYSPSSLRTYRIGLERFLAFCRERKLSAAGDLTDDCLQGFESWLCLSRPLSEATVSLWLRAAKSFMSWACLNGLTLYDGNSYSPPAGPSRTAQSRGRRLRERRW